MHACSALQLILLLATCTTAGRLCHAQVSPVVYVDSLQLAEQVESLVGGRVEVRTLDVAQWTLDWSSARPLAMVGDLRCIITECGRLDVILIERLRHQGISVVELQPPVGPFEYRAICKRWRRLASLLCDTCEEHRAEFQHALALELELLKQRHKAQLRSAGAGYARNHLDGLAAIRKQL